MVVASSFGVPAVVQAWYSVLPSTLPSAGAPASSSLLQERLVGKKFCLIYFSASWCNPCHRFTPHLEDLYRETKAQNLCQQPSCANV